MALDRMFFLFLYIAHCNYLTAWHPEWVGKPKASYNTRRRSTLSQTAMDNGDQIVNIHTCEGLRMDIYSHSRLYVLG